MDKDVVRPFMATAKAEFHFLESEFGFQLQGETVAEPDFLPDAEASVMWVGDGVGVKVYWYFAGAMVSVALAEAEGGRFPDKVYYLGQRRPAGIDLCDLIATRHPDAVPALPFHLSQGATFRAVKQRERIIRTDLRAVLQKLAELLKRHAHEALRGDTAVILQVRAAKGSLQGVGQS